MSTTRPSQEERVTVAEAAATPKPPLSYADPTTPSVTKASAFRFAWITSYFVGSFLATFALEFIAELLGKDGLFILRYEGLAGILDMCRLATIASLGVTLPFTITLSLRIYPTGRGTIGQWKWLWAAGLVNPLLLFGGLELTETLRGGQDGRFPLFMFFACVAYPVAVALWSGFRGQERG